MGAVLPKPVTTKVLERKGNKFYAVGGCSMNGFRENMEDAHCVHFDANNGPQNWGMFGIFDGHVNEKCSEYVGRELPLAVQEHGKIPMQDADLQKIVLKVDKKFGDLQSEGGSTGTFVIAHMEGDKYKLQIGNVGDSRVLVSRRGECETLTSDHKPDLPTERRRIEECGGIVENGRVDGSLAVSRAFGDMDYKRTAPTSDQLKQKVIALPDVTHSEITVGADDFIILCCDGVYEGEFTNAQIVEFAAAELKKNDDLAAVCSLVCDEAMLRGSKDNISCMIVKCCDGNPFTAKYPAHECIPGPFSAPSSGAFVTAYKKMLAAGNMSLNDALAHRYAYIKSTLPVLKQKYASMSPEDMSLAELRAVLHPMYMSPAQRTAWAETSRMQQVQLVQQKLDRGEDCTPNFVTELQAELEAFGEVPDDLSGEQAAAFFSAWANKKCETTQDNEMLQRLVVLQQQLGLPMPMLLNLLQRDGGPGGLGGGGRPGGI
eukprot:PhM_4_TR1727/c1_g1_i1/m.30574/K04461/PPM1B, PP2CB; protein phosphatase 1B